MIRYQYDDLDPDQALGLAVFERASFDLDDTDIFKATDALAWVLEFSPIWFFCLGLDLRPEALLSKAVNSVTENPENTY